MGRTVFLTDFSAWNHKISYSQPGSVDGDKENYPVPITVQYNASYMRSDFGDIRFVLQDGTELKYCIDNLVSGDHCDFLVVFPSLPASPTTTTIWVYGGNSEVTTTSDPSSVYDFNYDPTGATSIDADKWDTTNGSAFSIDNGLLKLNGNSFGQYLIAKSGGSTLNLSNFVIEAKLKSNGGYDEGGIVFCGQSNPSANSYVFHPSTYSGSYMHISERKNGASASELSSSITYTQHNTFFKVKITCCNGTISISIDDGTPITITNSDFTSGSFGPFCWGSTITWYQYLRAYKTTANPPASGTFGTWTANNLTISTPPIQSILTINTPQIAIGGGIRITTPPIGLISSINIPTLRAILTSPPITAVSAVIPPVLAFLMEVKAGVTYNPDAIDDLQRDGVPCNISFNMIIGSEQYE